MRAREDVAIEKSLRTQSKLAKVKREAARETIRSQRSGVLGQDNNQSITNRDDLSSIASTNSITSTTMSLSASVASEQIKSTPASTKSLSISSKSTPLSLRDH